MNPFLFEYQTEQTSNLNINNDNAYVFSCGVGKQDYGFVVGNVPISQPCKHKLAAIYAIVFSYFQKSTNAEPTVFIENREIKNRLKLDYALIYRYQMLLLLLVKNNHARHNILYLDNSMRCDEINIAVDHINHYLGMFCRVTDFQYIPLTIRFADRGSQAVAADESLGDILRVTNTSSKVSEKENASIELPLRIINVSKRMTTNRVAWIEPNVRYQFKEENESFFKVILKETFGFEAFKKGQFEMIRAMLGEDRLSQICIMPTGSGKSLIFYFLALLKSSPTIVISPTTVLIEDQIRNLDQLHNFDDVLHLQENRMPKDFTPQNRIIYLTPLTFMHITFIRRVIEMNFKQSLANIILDEVHCISNWSHDFHPEYLMLSSNLTEFVDKTGYKCFTGTANYTVIKDVVKQLGVGSSDIFYPIPIERKNFRYYFTSDNDDISMINKSANHLSKHLANNRHTKTIIFTKNHSSSLKFSKAMDKVVVDKADIYDPENTKSYIDFAQGHYPALIADTNMGVGINLPEIDDVFHIGAPISKSQFVQEIGRAGRFEQEARSHVFYRSKNSYSIEEIRLLSRSTNIDELVAMIENERVSDDLEYTFRKIFGFIERKDAFLKGVLNIYQSTKDKDQGYVLKIEVRHKTIREYRGIVYKYMRNLYVLYQTGVINRWYINAMNPKDSHVSFYIDPKGVNNAVSSLQDMKQKTSAHLLSLGSFTREVYRIKQADTVPVLIEAYLDWYYNQFLYHHREQYLEMIDFLENNATADSYMIAEGLKNYFSLSLLEIDKESATVNNMTYKDITEWVVRDDIPRQKIDSIRLSNENVNTPKQDYFLYLYDLINMKRVDFGRLQRLLQQTVAYDLTEIIESIPKYYAEVPDQDKIKLINICCEKVSLARVIDSIYSQIDKDFTFWSILSMCGNMSIGEVLNNV